MSYREEWNIPDDYDALVAAGDAKYSILGVETTDNMDSMRRFLDAVGVPAEKIEADDGTQVTLTHPDLAKVIIIDSGGLGDFFDSSFDVSVQNRDEST